MWKSHGCELWLEGASRAYFRKNSHLSGVAPLAGKSSADMLQGSAVIVFIGFHLTATSRSSFHALNLSSPGSGRFPSIANSCPHFVRGFNRRMAIRTLPAVGRLKNAGA